MQQGVNRDKSQLLLNLVHSIKGNLFILLVRADILHSLVNKKKKAAALRRWGSSCPWYIWLLIRRGPLEPGGNGRHHLLHAFPSGGLCLLHRTCNDRVQGDGRVVAPEAHEEVLRHGAALLAAKKIPTI